MSTIDPNKKIQKVHTEQEMRMALNDFISQKYALHIPPQVEDADIVLSDAIAELLEARNLLASFDTTPYEKLSDEQKAVVHDFRGRISDILMENLEPFYQEHTDLVFSWGLSLNVFLRADKQEMQEQ